MSPEALSRGWRPYTIAAWILLALWFASLLIAFVASVGPGIPFLYWTVPALPLYLLTWWWLTQEGRLVRHAGASGVLLIWLIIAGEAWYTIEHSLAIPYPLLATVLTVIFPFIVTWLALRGIHSEKAAEG